MERVKLKEPGMAQQKREILDLMISEFKRSNMQIASKVFTNMMKIKKFALLKTEMCERCGTLKTSDYKDKHKVDTCFEKALKDCVWLKYKPAGGYYCVICLQFFKSLIQLQAHMAELWPK